MNQVHLQKFQLGFESKTSSVFLEQAVSVEDLGSTAALHFLGSLWGESHQVKRVVYPTNWWEALKHRFAPEWAKKRWPVRYAVVTLDARILAPRSALNYIISPRQRDLIVPWIEPSTRIHTIQGDPVFLRPSTKSVCDHCGEERSFWSEDRELVHPNRRQGGFVA